MQLLFQYYINYDLWDMTATCMGRQLGLKYYIGAIGRSSNRSSSLRFHGFGQTAPTQQLSNYRATAACKESEGDQWTYWMNYWATGRTSASESDFFV